MATQDTNSNLSSKLYLTLKRIDHLIMGDSYCDVVVFRTDFQPH